VILQIAAGALLPASWHASRMARAVPAGQLAVDITRAANIKLGEAFVLRIITSKLNELHLMWLTHQ